MEMNKETQNQIQELQMFEQNLQSIMMQKQAFQMDFVEVETALEELSKTSQEVFKIVGNILIKSDKDSLMKELKHKKELLDLRLKSLNSQEKEISEQSEKLREKVLSKIQGK